MKVRDVMTSGPATVTPETTIADAARLLERTGASLLPVVSDAAGARLLGVLSDRDIVERCLAESHGPGCLVRAHMTTGRLETVHADDDLGLVEKRMLAGNVRRLPVLDEQRRVVGIVSKSDLVLKH
jgi:CBS domain-containing protein